VGTANNAKFRLHTPAQGGSFDIMIVPEAANMPPTPWQTEILAPGILHEGVAVHPSALERRIGLLLVASLMSMALIPNGGFPPN
jgi:hypothetical protein